MWVWGRRALIFRVFVCACAAVVRFGRPFNRERYNAVTFACALTRDFEILPNGDLTVCAERGINLSGGQRQRISLARAVYSDAQVYLLDGPLSAVDWSTSNHIMTHCFKGLLRGTFPFFSFLFS
jgi:ATP-binding cassette subfamily C (CFTR/MRP) protein 1